MTQSAAGVRYNEEYFGFIVGFPSGDIVLTGPEAATVLPTCTSVAELEPFLLPRLSIREPFHLNAPPLVWLEITRTCNLRCVHCYVSAGEPRANELSTERILGLLDEMALMGVWAVAITGGEPTMHPDFSRIVHHARRKGLLVGVATNGLFLTDELLDSLPRDGVIISISIDDLHIVAPNSGAEFRAVSKAIQRCHRHGFLTNLMTNTHRQNVDGLAEVISWARDNGVSIRSVPFSPLGRGKDHLELENTIADVGKAAKFWAEECQWEHEYHRKAGLCVGVIFNYGLSLGYMTRRCSSGRFLCYVCSDGTVYPCTMTAGEEILAAGDVRELNFADVWRSEWAIREFSWSRFDETCRDCSINAEAYYCAARCPAMSYARHKTFHECGASPFEIVSTVARTSLIERTDTGKGSGVPLVDSAVTPTSKRKLPVLF